MAAYTTTDFLASVRMRGSIPTTTSTNNVNNTANLLALATEELHIKLLPMLLKAREEFYVRKLDQAVVSGTAAYAIPSRASGMILRDVQLIIGTDIFSLNPVDSEVIRTTATGDIQGFYLEHNNVVLYPTPSTNNATLRLRYFQRPAILAATSACAQISAIDTVAFTVTVNSVPSRWATGTLVDFVKATVPFDNPAVDQSIVSVASSVITFTSLPSTLAVGDWVSLSEYTPIPQIPYEMQALLAQMTVVKALEALGDKQGASDAKADLDIIQANAMQLISPRVQGAAKKVVARQWRR